MVDDGAGSICAGQGLSFAASFPAGAPNAVRRTDRSGHEGKRDDPDASRKRPLLEAEIGSHSRTGTAAAARAFRRGGPRGKIHDSFTECL